MTPRHLALALALAGCGPKPAPAPAASAPEPAEPTEPTATVAPEPETPSEPRSLLLWEARKDETVSHLLGTCHIAIPLDHALPAPHNAHLQGARVLVSELDLSGMLDPVEAVRLIFDPEVDLRQTLGEEDFTSLSVHLRSVMPATALVHTPPWAVAPMLGAVGASPGGDVALDVAVADLAADSGVEPAYLETAEEQIAMMRELEGDFVDVLRAGSEASAAHLDTSRRAVEACIDGDLTPLQEMLADPEAAESTRRMFDVRNEAWADRVVAEAEQGDAFVAVGAGHMIGDTGLIAQLEEAGFTITRLPTEAAPTADRDALTDIPAFEPSTVPPEKVDAWMATLEADGAFVDRLCAEGELVRTCYVSDAAACRERVRSDLELCVAQLSPDLPDAPDPTSLQTVLGCGMSGLGIEALATGSTPSEPVCVQVREGMLGAMESMLDAQR